MFDVKLTLSIITGGVATAAAFRQDLDALLASHKSLVSQMKDEEERLGQIERSLRELNRNEGSSADARLALENDRRIAFARLKRLTSEFSRQREDPNYDLSFLQRLFLLFRPGGERAEKIHWLGCAFMALGIISILCWGCVAQPNLQNKDHIEEFIADFAVLGCYGALLFRTWALAERRWRHHYNRKSSVLHALLIIKGPAKGALRWAQACFWVCLYWIIESLDDFVEDVFSGQAQRIPEVLIKFMVPLVAALLCRYWTVAELRYARRQSISLRRRARIPASGCSTVAMMIVAAALVGAITILVHKLSFFPELEHRIALVVQAVISCVACSQGIALSSVRAPSTVPEPIAVKAQSALA